jgi:predicted aspartyl protease
MMEGMRVGAVRVHVRLTNGIDEGLVRTGQLQQEDVRTYEGEALVDTGAVKSVIPAYVMQTLGLPAIERTPVQYVDGRVEMVEMTGPITMRIYGRRSNEDAYVLGDEILTGQTALESMDLHVDCLNQRLIPNPKHPDRPVLRV